MSLSSKAYALKTRHVTGPVGHGLYRLRFAADANRRGCFVHSGTQLCLEGFPRSANSYAYNMFRAANPQVTRYGRHVHTVSQISRAVALRVPTLLVIRDPKGSVASLLKHFSPDALPDLLDAYIAFYQGVLPLSGQVVVSDFGQTTGDLNCAIAALNARFATSFRLIEQAHETEVRADLETFRREGRGTRGLPPIRTEAERAADTLPEFPAQALSRAETLYQAVRAQAVQW